MHWIATPHIPPDHRGPADHDYQPFGDPAAGRPLVDSLRAMVVQWPQAIAVEEAGGVMTLEDLWRRAAGLAGQITHAVPEDSHVGILLPAGAAYMVAVFACLMAGRVMVPLDAASPDARNTDIVERARIKLVLAEPHHHRSAYAGASVLAVDSRIALGSQPEFQTLPVDLDAPAVIVCTSGSSGRPKLIVHSQRAMMNWVRIHHDSVHLTHHDRMLSLSSPASLAGFAGFLSAPLAAAATQVVDIKSAGLGGLLETLASRPVTQLRAAPSMLRGLARLPEARISFAGLRVVHAYGEPLLKADVVALRQSLPEGCFIRSTYGATESSGLQWFADDDDAYDPVRIAAGILQPDTMAAIVGDDGVSCSDGEPGELWIRSRYNALGEWNGDQLVPGRLLPDQDDAGSRIYKTGDVARYHGDGVFTVLGRKDRMIKVNGQRLEPGEIEVALRALPEVREAEVVVDPRSEGPRLLAFVVADPRCDGAKLPALLRAELRRVLPSFMIPSRILVVDAMPRLPNGKVDGLSLLARPNTPDVSVSIA